MYSAKKVDGKKLYELARQGKSIERKPVRVVIYEIELIETPSPTNFGHGTLDFGLRAVCSAGTYIRTLAEDIGRKLGTGAHLTELRRTGAGRFTIGDAITLEHLENMSDPSDLLPIETAVAHLSSLALNDDRVEKTRNGMSTRIFDHQFSDGETLRITDASDNLIAIGIYDEAESSVQPKIVLV
jgi:tRNA pseudouridine55 synthase